MRSLPTDDVENIFALAFALEQWRGNLQRLSASLSGDSVTEPAQEELPFKKALPR
jgi:hypothetical protein